MSYAINCIVNRVCQPYILCNLSKFTSYLYKILHIDSLLNVEIIEACTNLYTSCAYHHCLTQRGYPKEGNMKKRAIAILAAAAMSVAALAGCGSSGSGSTAAGSTAAPEATTQAATQAASTEDSAAPVEDLGDFEMIVGHAQPEGNPRYVSMEKFAEDVSTKTDGHVKVTVYGNGQLGTEKEMLEQVVQGTVQGMRGGQFDFSPPPSDVHSSVPYPESCAGHRAPEV